MAIPTTKLLLTGLAVLAFAALSGVAFAGWLNHGAAIFLTYTSNGLGWCF